MGKQSAVGLTWAVGTQRDMIWMIDELVAGSATARELALDEAHVIGHSLPCDSEFIREDARIESMSACLKTFISYQWISPYL
jgi:hypothetical protein